MAVWKILGGWGAAAPPPPPAPRLVRIWAQVMCDARLMSELCVCVCGGGGMKLDANFRIFWGIPSKIKYVDNTRHG